MAVKDLNDAALVLKGAHQAIKRLLDETEPMEREHLQRKNILLSSPGGDELPQEVFDKMDIESGYRAFYDWTDELRQLLQGVDQLILDEMKRSLVP